MRLAQPPGGTQRHCGHAAGFLCGQRRELPATDTVRERAYSRRTWEKLLEETGFGVEAVYGEDMLSPPAPQEERWVFVARRI